MRKDGEDVKKASGGAAEAAAASPGCVCVSLSLSLCLALCVSVGIEMGPTGRLSTSDRE